jgi:hypothetical protein
MVQLPVASSQCFLGVILSDERSEESKEPSDRQAISDPLLCRASEF